MPSRNVKIQILLAFGLGTVLIVFLHGCYQSYSVRTEFSEVCKRQGYGLFQAHNNEIYTVNPAARSLKGVRQFLLNGNAPFGVLSSDGSAIAFAYYAEPGPPMIAVSRSDGTQFQQLPRYSNPLGICWSHDKSKLALTLDDRTEGNAPSLDILDLNSNSITEIAGLDNWTTSQCWSPDDAQLVYTENKPLGIQNVRIFDTRRGQAHTIAHGSEATWSPDGTWIAFSQQSYDAYDVIRPNGTGEKVLFRTTINYSALWWSPDSRFVAYISARSWSEGGWPESGRDR